MSERREPSTYTSPASHKGTCYRCKQPIQAGADQIVAFDGVNALTFHVECPAYPTSNAAMTALTEYLKETQ